MANPLALAALAAGLIFTGTAEAKVLNLTIDQHDYVIDPLQTVSKDDALALSRGRVVLLVGDKFDRPRLQTILRGLEQAQYPVEVYRGDWKNVPPNKLKFFYDGKPVLESLDKDMSLEVVEPFLDKFASYLKGTNPAPNAK